MFAIALCIVIVAFLCAVTMFLDDDSIPSDVVDIRYQEGKNNNA